MDSRRRNIDSIGSFNQKVSIYSITETLDNQGGVTEAGVKQKTTWAKIEPMTGVRALEYGQLVHGKPYRVLIRKRKDIAINENYYLVFGSKTLWIHSVINLDEADKFLEIIAYEKS
jgi:SPP1 family predicted phage head-tail adaptor